MNILYIISITGLFVFFICGICFANSIESKKNKNIETILLYGSLTGLSCFIVSLFLIYCY